MSAPRVLGAWLALTLAFTSAGARAADQPPAAPAAATTPAAAPDSEPPPPAINAPATPAPALEAGDTAPPAAAPWTVAPNAVDPGAPGAQPAPHEPLSANPWFWGGIAAVFLTVAIISTLALGGGDPATPQTSLKDMRAF